MNNLLGMHFHNFEIIVNLKTFIGLINHFINQAVLFMHRMLLLCLYYTVFNQMHKRLITREAIQHLYLLDEM